MSTIIDLKKVQYLPIGQSNDDAIDPAVAGAKVHQLGVTLLYITAAGDTVMADDNGWTTISADRPVRSQQHRATPLANLQAAVEAADAVPALAPVGAA
jgi:hypothetical protein